ncbi:uncharacterized protein RAG0_11971 [Rhynchosporium agropyri]|uniref:Uncharacterized protein n=1 Tax=Rhynchosporium agropyri TaxID=914238 RepID=A0A1E1L6V8_9HELO|nr:uncharacterized protein RAG0_11971 [Rhynchosporium agropyri]
MPFFRRVCAMLHLGKTEPAKFNFIENNKWLEKGVDGYITEGFVGHYNCPSCHAKINAYRSVLQTYTRTSDCLRFEQFIEGSSGRCVMQVPITFEKDFVAMERGLLTPKALDSPCKCEIVKEEFFACCTCVNCGQNLSFWNQVKRCEVLGKLRWFLARKEDKALEEKLALAEEWALER